VPKLRATMVLHGRPVLRLRIHYGVTCMSTIIPFMRISLKDSAAIRNIHGTSLFVRNVRLRPANRLLMFV
jgi:hypothetical protein